jgi:hypothetical protein
VVDWLTSRGFCKLLTFSRNLFEGGGESECSTSKCALQRTHEENLCILVRLHFRSYILWAEVMRAPLNK